MSKHRLAALGDDAFQRRGERLAGAGLLPSTHSAYTYARRGSSAVICSPSLRGLLHLCGRARPRPPPSRRHSGSRRRPTAASHTPAAPRADRTRGKSPTWMSVTRVTSAVLRERFSRTEQPNEPIFFPSTKYSLVRIRRQRRLLQMQSGRFHRWYSSSTVTPTMSAMNISWLPSGRTSLTLHSSETGHFGHRGARPPSPTGRR